MLLASCKKQEAGISANAKQQNAQALSKDEVISFLNNQIKTAKQNPADSNSHFLINIKADYRKLYRRKSPSPGSWNLPLEGSPTYHGQKLGYRKLHIFRDSTTKKVTAEVIEVLPDPIALQLGQINGPQHFSGKIFRYNLSYHLSSGAILSNGKTTGEIRPGPAPFREHLLNSPVPIKGSSSNDPLMLAIVASCSWSQDWYIDGEGSLTIHSSMSCSYSFYQDCMWSIYDDFGGGGGGNYDYEYGSGGSGSTGPSTPATPEPSNLPMEDAKPVDPEKMMDCFALITTPNAAFTVRVLVVEPFAGTSFNLGPNSFGHVAIQLSKTGNGQTITQTIGLYPTGTGLAKLESRGQILDNGDLKYDLGATYAVNSETFNKLISYIGGERKDYHFTDFNCASYVYQAGQAAGINIPNPITNVGISGPGGAGFADTPAGMAAALREQKAKNPGMDLNQGGGKASPSKGPCNK
ncbi:hypothetical protein DBR40_07160 [Pedobacter sp. KBW01]|nr:hypothetical protein DBR40_07160 [Pedobacter sp. KBW01]